MKIESVKIASLKFDSNNARKHDEKNLQAIEQSLREFGQRKPIVITKAGVIVAGNGTTEAATRLGWSEIQAVTIPDDWTSEKTKAFALADNRTAELAAWDTEILNAQLQELRESEINIQLLGFEVKNLDLPEDLFSESDAPRLDQRSSISCPQCGCEFRQGAKGYEII